jgi:hypothetical protein
MDHNHHEHKMVPVDRPAVQSAKKLCFIVLALASGFGYYYLQSPPATRALIDAYDFWPCVVIGAIVAIVALRAAFSR